MLAKILYVKEEMDEMNLKLNVYLDQLINFFILCIGTPRKRPLSHGENLLDIIESVNSPQSLHEINLIFF